jgi:hypothetical protein
VLGAGFLAAAAAGVVAYRLVGPYGDGPFGAGYRRVPAPAGGVSVLVHEASYGSGAVRTVVDERTRRTLELQIDGDGDGAVDTRARVETDGLVRVERDLDGDGAPDRWEYYRDAQDAARGRVAKVGFSLAGDAVVDAWAFYGPEGRIARVEVSTARDGVVDRWEFYEHGALVRVGTDGDGDGRVDAWSAYEDGILAPVPPDGAGAQPGGTGGIR